MKLQNILWALAILIVAAFYTTPYISVYELKSAAQNNDYAKLEQYIEFQTLRNNFKVKMRSIITKGLNDKNSGTVTADASDPLGSLGQIIVNALIDPLVNSLVTPEVIAAIIRGEKPSQSFNNIKNNNIEPASPNIPDETVAISKKDESKSAATTSEEKNTNQEIYNKAERNIKIAPAYSSLTKFKVRIINPDNQDSEIILIMKRRNLFSWSVYDVDVPALNKVGEDIATRLGNIGQKGNAAFGSNSPTPNNPAEKDHGVSE